MSLLGWLFRSADLEHYKRGIAHFNAGEYEEAIAALEEALSRSCDDRSAYHRLERFYAAEAHARMGEALLERGDTARAEASLAKAVALGQEYPDRLALLARIKHVQGDPHSAVDLLARALALNPSYRTARAERALCLDELGDHSEAWQEVRLLAADDAALGRLEVSASEGALPNAVRSHLMQLVQQGGEPKRRVRRAEAYAADGDPERARAEFESLVRDYPDYPDMRVRLAILMHTQGHCSEARLHLQRALEINPRYAEARLQLGIVSLKEGRPAEAQEQLAAVAALQADHPALPLLHGLALIRCGKWGEARQLLEQAADDVSGRPQALLALLHWAEGRVREAREEFALVQRANPGLGWAAAAFAELCAAAGEAEPARQCLENSLRLQPEDRRLQMTLARLLHQDGRWEASLEAVDRILATDGQDAAALAWKGRLMAERGRYGEATDCLREAVGLRRASSADWQVLGHALLQQGANAEASEALRLAVDRPQAPWHTALDLALSYYRQSRPADGARMLADVTEGADHPLVRMLVSPAFVDEL